jgi:hypothetical protein
MLNLFLIYFNESTQTMNFCPNLQFFARRSPLYPTFFLRRRCGLNAQVWSSQLKGQQHLLERIRNKEEVKVRSKTAKKLGWEFNLSIQCVMGNS